MARLKDGEKRLMRPAKWIEAGLDVIAYRVDCDSPCVILKSKDDGKEILLTDSEATDMITRIQRALDILPTSK